MIPDDHDLTVRHIQNWMKARGGGGGGGVKRPNVIDTPTLQTIVGCWNVRTTFEIVKLAQLAQGI